MKLSLKKIVTPPLPATIAMIAAGYLLWIVYYVSGISKIPSQNTTDPILNVAYFFSSQSILPYIFNAALTLLNAILIFQLNNRYSIIRTRTLLPVIIFNLLVGVWFQTHSLTRAHITLTLLIGALYVFFDMYRNKNAAIQAFTGSLLIGIGGFFVKPILVLMPVFWIGFMQLKCFSLRTWLASLFGFINPWIFYFVVGYLINPDLLKITEHIKDFIPHFIFPSIALHEIIYITSLIIFIILASAGIIPNLRNDSIQTRSRLSFISLYTVAIFTITIFSATDYKALMLLIAPGYSMLFSHPLSLRFGNFYSIVFVVFLVINLAFVVSNFII
ncbi:MAG: hypothetical protein JXR27_07545 [Paludibacteraceae bacterium]|nr:hypothetical protein [Paludibacteraceae bacterium]